MMYRKYIIVIKMWLVAEIAILVYINVNNTLEVMKNLSTILNTCPSFGGSKYLKVLKGTYPQVSLTLTSDTDKFFSI